MSDIYDLLIVGGGPGGYTAAERAGRAGLKVLLAERRALGGTCLNEGCIPSKALLNSAKIFDYAKHGGAYGVNVAGASIDHAAAVARKDKVVGTLVSGVRSLMRASEVAVVYGEAEILDRSHMRIGADVYEGARMILATGSEPVIPPIPGLAEALASGFALTSREILDLREIPGRLVIAGGGVIGLEMASYFNSAGSEVTVVEMLPEIGGQLDPGIAGMLRRIYAKKGVRFALGTRVTGIRPGAPGSVITESGGAETEFAADKLLLSIGRRPLIKGFGLERLGVAADRGGVMTDGHMMTNVPGVYAVGDITGRYMLAHAAYREADVAVNHILGKRDVMRYDAVPSVIYTAPEAASVGYTEEAARADGIECLTARAPMILSGRFLAENAGVTGSDGVCKLVIEKNSRRVIGAHVLGSYASEIIVSAGIMIELQLTAEDAKEIIFPHPTVGEIIRETIYRF